MSSEPVADARPRKPIRRWPALVILALAAMALAWIWIPERLNRQNQFVFTVMALFATGILMLIWALAFSRMRWWVRLVVLVVAIGLVVLPGRFVEVREVSGDLVPSWTWRGAPEPDETLAELTPAARETPAAVASQHDFPQFLGPRRNGVVDSVQLARDWSARPPREIWRRPVGAGWSGFAVAGQIAVTQEQRGPRELVVAYDLTTGEPIWLHADEARFETVIAGTGPRATPTIHGGRVYTLGATGILNCLDLVTGEVAWSRNILEDSEAPLPEYGTASSPLVIDDRVVVSAGGKDGRSLVAYGREDGEPIWGGGDTPTGYSSPILATLAGTPQILVFQDPAVAAHDPADGRLLWQHAWPETTEMVANPVPLPGDRVFVSSGYGIGGKLFQVRAAEDGTLSVETIWETTRMKAKFTNVIYKDGFIYGLDDGVLACLDLADGERRWKHGRYGHGQVLLVGDLLVVQAEDGDVVLVEASPEYGGELGRIPALEGKSWNNPALAGPYLLVRNHGEAACYELPLEEL